MLPIPFKRIVMDLIEWLFYLGEMIVEHRTQTRILSENLIEEDDDYEERNHEAGW